MKFRKYIALLICAVLVAGVMTSCSQPVKSPFVSEGPPSPSPSPSTSASPTVGAQINNEGAYASIDPKTVMLTVGGRDIAWDELFFYIHDAISGLESNGVNITGWSAVYQDEVTFKDYVLNTAVDNILQNAALGYGAEQLKVTLSPEDEADVQAAWAEQVNAAGSEEAFLGKLTAVYCTKDIYLSLQEISALASVCFTTMYGEMGGNLDDQDIADFIAEDGYLMAKHILMLTKKTDESGNEVAMSDTEKAEVKEKMDAILSQLKAYKGDDFNTFFSQLMAQNSEDPGAVTYPNGYLFTSGEMVSQFEEGTKALEIGQFSQELIESDYGYHIIYRIPVNYDETPMMYVNYGDYSLRYISALDMFKANIDTWLNSLDITYSDDYSKLDFDKIFAVG
jgi:hypothetical protein